MRRASPHYLLTLLPLLAAAPLCAQAFEGVVMVKMRSIGEVKYLIKGDKMVTVMTLGSGSGPMAGKEMRMITDRTTMKITMLVPLDMPGMKGFKMEMDLGKEAAKGDKRVEVKSLGTSETIAGYKCDNYEIKDDKTTTGLCLSTQLDMFVFPSSGGMGRGAAAPSWVHALGDHPGFPLRVTGSDGKVVLEVTSVQPGRVSADEFVIPEGYSSMPGMGGRGGF